MESKKDYEPPKIAKEEQMMFPIQLIESAGQGCVCKQCSSCHSCR